MTDTTPTTQLTAMKCSRSRCFGTWALALFVILWVPGFAWFYQQVPTPDFVVTPSVKVDAIVVLTGAKGRLEEGLKLLEEGRANRLFISGVGEGVKLHELALVAGLEAESPWLKEVARNGQVILGRKARSTEGNAQEVVTWMRENHYRTVLLVTSHYHVPRSLMELRMTMPDVMVFPVPVFPAKNYLPLAVHPPIEEPVFRILGHTMNTWRLILVEYHKYVVRRAMLALGLEM